MFLNVRDMELRPLRIKREFAIGEIDFFTSEFRQASPLVVEATAEFRSALEEIRVTGRFSVELEFDCDRCLAVFRWPIDKKIDLLYAPEDAVTQPEESGLNGEEVELGFYEGAGLELEEILREQVLLALPMQRVCREDCQGLCPTCGENWNERPCGCRIESADPRWSGLEDLKLKK
jgi:uncharacterized protein